MILQALYSYYDRMYLEGVPELEPQGFKRVEIPFLIIIKDDGSLIDIQETRSGIGKQTRAKPFMVPKIFEGSRTSNIKANLLWDKASYVFGVGLKTNPQRLSKQKDKFRETILEYFPDYQNIREVSAVVSFLEKYTYQAEEHKSWEEIRITDPNLAFSLDTASNLICNSERVVRALLQTKEDASGICLITGKYSPLVRLENPIKGLRRSGKAESHFVSFNESAYWSYGNNEKKQYANANISKKASSAYVAAINYLQRRESKQFLLINDSTIIFWAEKKHDIEDFFADIFGEPAKDNPIQDYKSLIATFRSPEIGSKPELDPKTHFYVLGLAPNAARIAVRFWYDGTVAQVSNNIYQHFDDCAIVHGPSQPETLSLFRLLVSTAVQEKPENIPPNLAGDFMRAILAGTPYPKTLLSSAIRRIRAKREISYPRVALIKAVLARETRYYNRNEKEVGMALDTTNNNIGYLMGRLFAVLEKIQEEANPGINATIRDRFYGAASSTPVAVFSLLMKLKNHHLSKLDNRGRAVNFERLIGEIMDGIDGFPNHLSLADQGRFAVGYYHQRQDFFTKKTVQ